MSSKSKQNKQEKFRRLHPEGRKIYSLKNKIKNFEDNLIKMKEKLENMRK